MFNTMCRDDLSWKRQSDATFISRRWLKALRTRPPCSKAASSLKNTSRSPRSTLKLCLRVKLMNTISFWCLLIIRNAFWKRYRSLLHGGRAIWKLFENQKITVCQLKKWSYHQILVCVSKYRYVGSPSYRGTGDWGTSRRVRSRYFLENLKKTMKNDHFRWTANFTECSLQYEQVNGPSPGIFDDV